MQSISLADELRSRRRAAGPASATRSSCPGLARAAPAENLAARALRGLSRGHRLAGAAAAPEHRKRIPVAAGSAAARPTPPPRCAWPRWRRGSATSALLRELARELGADVPAQLSPGRWLATGAGELLRGAFPTPSRRSAARAALAAQLSTAAVYARGRPARAGARARRTARSRREQLQRRWSSARPLPPSARAAAQRPAGGGAVAVPARSPQRSTEACDAGAEHARQRLGADGRRAVRPRQRGARAQPARLRADRPRRRARASPVLARASRAGRGVPPRAARARRRASTVGSRGRHRRASQSGQRTV